MGMSQASGAADRLDADDREDDADQAEDDYCHLDALVMAVLALELELLSSPCQASELYLSVSRSAASLRSLSSRAVIINIAITETAMAMTERTTEAVLPPGPQVK